LAFSFGFSARILDPRQLSLKVLIFPFLIMSMKLIFTLVQGM